MIRFLIILLLVVILLSVGISVIYRYLQKIFGIFNPNMQPKKEEKPEEDVVYNKDNIKVLKGEAKDSKKDFNKKS